LHTSIGGIGGIGSARSSGGRKSGEGNGVMSRSRRRTRKRRGECLKESGVPAFAETNRVKNLLVVLLGLLILLPLRQWLQEELKTKHAQIEAENAKISVANAKQTVVLNDLQHLYIVVYIFIHPLCKP
jgi:hypothetical protein